MRSAYLAALLLALTGCGDFDGPGPIDMAVSPKGETTNGAGLTPIAVAPAAPPAPVIAGRPSDAAAHAFAQSFLNSIQSPSIRDRVEYCGYFYVDGSGNIAATPPRRGTFASCNMPGPDPSQGIFASYHTHGAFGREYDNEVPSVTDLLSDFDFRIDGYVSTPGGRVWHVDYGTRSTTQVCGLRCVYQDPGFQPVGEGGIRASYTLPQLGRRANGF